MPLLIDEVYVKYLADKLELRTTKGFLAALSDMVQKMFIESAKTASEHERVTIRVGDLAEKAFICVPKKPENKDS